MKSVKEMNIKEIVIMQEFITNTLHKIARYYTKNEIMTKDKFFEIQIKELNKIKNKLFTK